MGLRTAGDYGSGATKTRAQDRFFALGNAGAFYSFAWLEKSAAARLTSWALSAKIQRMDSNSAFINCVLAAMRRFVCTLLLMGASAWAGWLLFGAGLQAIAIGTVIMFAITPLCMIVFFRERCRLEGGFAMVFTFAATAFALFAFVEIEFESRLAMLDVVRPAAATPWAPLENAFTEARRYASMALSALLCIGAMAGPRPRRPPAETPLYDDLLLEPEAPTHTTGFPASPSSNCSRASGEPDPGAQAPSKKSKSRSSGGRAGGSRSGASGVAAKTASAADRSSAGRSGAKRQNRKPAEKPRPRRRVALTVLWLRRALATAVFLAAALMAGTAAGEDAKTHRLARDGLTSVRQTGIERNWALQAISFGQRVEADFSVKLQKESLIDLFGDHFGGLSGTRSAWCASRLLTNPCRRWRQEANRRLPEENRTRHRPNAVRQRRAKC